ncbi:MAG: hypothetical protein AMXMBFR22_25500 [Phycisphaerae bacterium]
MTRCAREAATHATSRRVSDGVRRCDGRSAGGATHPALDPDASHGTIIRRPRLIIPVSESPSFDLTAFRAMIGPREPARDVRVAHLTRPEPADLEDKDCA